MNISRTTLLICLVVLLVVGGLAWATAGRWLPAVERWRAGEAETASAQPHEDEHDHDHDHEHADEHALELSAQARRNIGLKTGPVELQTYQHSITIPAMVVERPGWSRINVAAPLTGVVTGVYVLQGEAVRSDMLLFKLRLTHEDLVVAQTEFLRTLGQLDVEQREIARLEEIPAGAIPGRTLLEREYERDKLEAARNAQREALLLHGLSPTQIDRIANERRLVREVSIYVPHLHEDASLHSEAEPEIRENHSPATQGTSEDHTMMSRQFVVMEVNVRKGSVVQAGEPLCVLGDFSELFIEGRAFEQDAEELVTAAKSNLKVSALTEDRNSDSRLVRGLTISHVANEVDPESRALHVYVRLPNTIARDAVRDDGRHFRTWRFKMGQRMQLRVPVENWENVIVLPVDAVAVDGAEAFVFVENGDHFDRRAVHVRYRDRTSAVIANDGSLFPGEIVAMSGAHQMLIALKNKAGGGVDPHAGHSH